MAARNRDEFSAKTQRALALRANFRCSYPGCRKPTSGPSDESPEAHISIGVAAHIHAAAPGGPRYMSEMLPEARSAVTNGLWLCQTHSRLVDADRARFPPAVLGKMRTDHEDHVRTEMDSAVKSAGDMDFIAIGPDLVLIGELMGAKDATWDVRIEHFLIGDLGALIEFDERFDRIAPMDRFVLVNALGDGRQLAAAPDWQKSDVGVMLSLKVHPSTPRTNAHELPADIATNDANDIFLTNGDLAIVFGLESLPQKIRMCLSTPRGEMSFHPTFGTRIKEYFDLFRDSPWLPHLVKLEVIRMACVPIDDLITGSSYTALRSVSRVRGIEQLPSHQKENWIPFRLHLDIEGIGPWQCDLPIFIPLGAQ